MKLSIGLPLSILTSEGQGTRRFLLTYLRDYVTTETPEISQFINLGFCHVCRDRDHQWDACYVRRILKIIGTIQAPTDETFNLHEELKNLVVDLSGNQWVVG